MRMNTLGAAGLGSTKERGRGTLRIMPFPRVYVRKSTKICLLAPRCATVEVEGGIRQD